MKKRVLILCTSNSARSQMAEGLLRRDAGDRFQVESAGAKPSSVRPEAIAVMREAGIDISGHRSKSVEEFAGQEFDYVITVCDQARETCPVFFGKAQKLHHDFEDPAGFRAGTGTAGRVPERAGRIARISAEFQRGHPSLTWSEKRRPFPPARLRERFSQASHPEEPMPRSVLVA